MSSRKIRQEQRIIEAGWRRSERKTKFIQNFLRKRGISINKNSCMGPLTDGIRSVLKNFKRIAGGGVGVVWGCDQCVAGSVMIGKITSGQLVTGKFPPFGGHCRNSMKQGDANTLIILPYIKNLSPRIINTTVDTIATKKGLVERRIFNVLA